MTAKKRTRNNRAKTVKMTRTDHDAVLNAPVLEALEPRILFDAAAPAALVQGLEHADAQAAEAAQAHADNQDTARTARDVSVLQDALSNTTTAVPGAGDEYGISLLALHISDNKSPELTGDDFDLPMSDKQTYVGDLFSGYLEDNNNDEDTFGGIVVVATQPGDVDGAWQYRVSEADDWINIGDVSVKQALVLTAETEIRFLPANGDTTGNTPKIGFVAWEKASNLAQILVEDDAVAGTVVDLSDLSTIANVELRTGNPHWLSAGLDSLPSFGNSDVQKNGTEDELLYLNKELQLDAGAFNDTSFTLTFTVPADHGSLITHYPDDFKISADGTTMTITGTIDEITAANKKFSSWHLKPAEDYNGPYDITVTLSGDGVPDQVMHFTGTIRPANDAPVVADTSDASFGTVNSDLTPDDQPGRRVDSFIEESRFSDPKDALNGQADIWGGIVITDSKTDPATQGVWQYKDADGKWQNIEVEGNSSNGLMLSRSVEVRFKAVEGFKGEVQFECHVYEIEKNGDEIRGDFTKPPADAESHFAQETFTNFDSTDLFGGTSPFSENSFVVKTTVGGSTIDLPGVDPADPTSDRGFVMHEDGTIDMTGVTIDSIAGNLELRIEQDGNRVGIIQGGTTAGVVTLTGSVEEINAQLGALKLTSTVPDWNGDTQSLKFTLTDTATGAVIEQVASVIVKPVNDAPVMVNPDSEYSFGGTFNSRAEDAAIPTTKVSDVLPEIYGGYHDLGDPLGDFNDTADQIGKQSGDDFAGIVVTDLGADPTTEGVWQVKDPVNGWKDIPAVSETNGFMIGADLEIRFKPVPGFNGEPKITYHYVEAETNQVNGETGDFESQTPWGADSARTFTGYLAGAGAEMKIGGSSNVSEGSSVIKTGVAGDPKVIVPPVDNNDPTGLKGFVTDEDVSVKLDGLQVSVADAVTKVTVKLELENGRFEYNQSATAEKVTTPGEVNDWLSGLTFVPTEDWNGEESVKVTITDNLGGTTVTTFAITVISVNDAPVMTTPDNETPFADKDGNTSFSSGLPHDQLPSATVEEVILDLIFSGEYDDSADSTEDGEGDPFAGIVITGTPGTGTLGSWQYNDPVQGWTDLPPVSETNGFMIGKDVEIRFKPSGNGQGGVPKLEYHFVEQENDPAEKGDWKDQAPWGDADPSTFTGYINGQGKPLVTGGSSNVSEGSSLISFTMTASPDITVPTADPQNPQTGNAFETDEDVSVSLNGLSVRVDDDLAGSDVTVTLKVLEDNGVNNGKLDNRLTVTKTGSLDEINEWLKTVTYKPNPDYFGEQKVEITVTDALGGTETTQFVIDVNPVNDAPVMGNPGNQFWLNEDGKDGGISTMTPTDNLPAKTVGELIGAGEPGFDFSDDADSIAQAGPDTFLGIVITGNTVAERDGAWEYLTPAGGWEKIPTDVSETKGFLIGENVKIRFVPANGFSGTPELEYRYYEHEENTADEKGDWQDQVPAGVSKDFAGWVRTDGNPMITGGSSNISDDVSSIAIQIVGVPSVTVPPMDPNVPDQTGFTGPEDKAVELSDIKISCDPLVTEITVTLRIEQGQFLDEDGNPLTDAGGQPRTEVTLTGDPEDVAKQINGLSYLAPQDWNGQTVIDMRVEDHFGSAVLTPIAVTVTPVNDAPVGAEDVTLDAIDEDVKSANNNGQSIKDLIGDHFDDARDAVGEDRADSFAGIAIVGGIADPDEGVWQYRTPGGDWVSITDAAEDNALVLTPEAELRFNPKPNWNGTPEPLVYVLIETTQNDETPLQIADGATIDVSGRDSESPFSERTGTIGITVNPVNDAPLGAEDITLDTIDEDISSDDNSGTVIRDVIGGFDDSKDAEGEDRRDTFAGIAVIGGLADPDHGFWQYQDDAGEWQNIPAVSEENAFVIGADTAVRFQPNENWNGTPEALQYVVIETAQDDEPSHNIRTGETNNVKDRTETSPYSQAVGTLAITVRPVNDDPTITIPVVPGKDDPQNPDPQQPGHNPTPDSFKGFVMFEDGTLTLSGLTIGDVDSDEVSVTLKVTNGTLNGQTEVTFKGTPDAVTAWINTLVYTPESNWNGTETVQVTMDDQDGGTVNSTFAILVKPVNDAPTGADDADFGTIMEDIENVDNTGKSVADLVKDFFLDDADKVGDATREDSFVGIVIIGTAADPTTEGVWQYFDGAKWVDIEASEQEGLFLEADTMIRFAPVKDYNGQPGSLTYVFAESLNDDETGDRLAAGNTVDVSGANRGGETRFSEKPGTISITVMPENDNPTIDIPIVPGKDDPTNPDPQQPGHNPNTNPFNGFVMFEDGTLTLSGLKLDDVDSAQITVTLKVTNGTFGGETEVSYTGTLADATTWINSLVYTPNADWNGTEKVEVRLDDHDGAIVDKRFNILVKPVNDAPTGAEDITLDTIDEDISSDDNTGTVIRDVLLNFDDAKDAEGEDRKDTFAGIAVIGGLADPDHGFWQYLDDAGAWQNIPAVSEENAFVIGADTAVRFQPKENWFGTPEALQYVVIETAQDDEPSHNIRTGETNNVKDRTDTSPYSQAVGTLAITVRSVNDDPTITIPVVPGKDDPQNPDPQQPGHNPTPDSFKGFVMLEDGTLTLNGLTIGDIDSDEVSVTLKVTNGTLGGETQVTVTGTPAEVTAQINALVYTPNADWNGMETVDVTIDDQDGGTVNTMFNILVKPVNDAPTGAEDVVLDAVDEDITSDANAGQKVEDIIGGFFNDTKDAVGDDRQDTFFGIAITGNKADPATGVWQYFDGAQWMDIPVSVSGSSSLVLDKDTMIRFQPAANWNGTPAPLKYVVIETVTADENNGQADTLATGDRISTAVRGDETRFSAEEATIAIVVNPVNDAPTAEGEKDLPPVTAGTPEDRIPGTSITEIVKPFFDDSTDDVEGGSDADNFDGAVITGNTSTPDQGTWQVKINGTWTDIPADVSPDNAIYVGPDDQIRFVPNTGFKGTPGGISLQAVEAGTGYTSGQTVSILQQTGGTGHIADGVIKVGTSVKPWVPPANITNQPDPHVPGRPDNPNKPVDKPFIGIGDVLYNHEIDNVDWGDWATYFEIDLETQYVRVGERHVYELSAAEIRHTDPTEDIKLEARQADGRALPSWIFFNPKDRSFVITPDANAETVVVIVRGRDEDGLEAQAIFEVIPETSHEAAQRTLHARVTDDRGHDIVADLDRQIRQEAKDADGHRIHRALMQVARGN